MELESKGRRCYSGQDGPYYHEEMYFETSTQEPSVGSSMHGQPRPAGAVVQGDGKVEGAAEDGEDETKLQLWKQMLHTHRRGFQLVPLKLRSESFYG